MFNLLIYFNLLIFSLSADADNQQANKILVVYFSCTGNTKRIAKNINSLIGGDLKEIIPKIPYTNEDLNYNNNDCRANKEQRDPSILPEISNEIENINEYTTIFIGYPIWHGKAPNIIRTFLKKYDFSNKNIITFSTSASSLDSSKSFLPSLAPSANWNDNFQRFSSSAAKSTVKEWLQSLNVKTSILIVYFSATGNTENVANYIQNSNLADIKEIEPVNPYSSDDLNYDDPDSRASQEHKDPNLRPEINDIGNVEDYNIIFVGYPIWWGKAPHVVYTFIESKDLNNKIIIPFCTSGSSGLGESGRDLQSKVTKNSKWHEGKRFGKSEVESTVATWVESIDFSEIVANEDDKTDDDNKGDDNNNDNNDGDNNDNNDDNNNDNNDGNNNSNNNKDHGNSNDHKIVVAYFSATGNTKRVAQNIHNYLKYGRLVEITPVEPYSSSDLDYRNSESRVSKEHQNPSLRPQFVDISGIDQAETIFVGYPLWWQEALHVVYTFIEKYKLKDKTIIPFCTSASSSIGKSDKNLADKAEGAKWFNGIRFQSGVKEDEVKEWIDDIVETNSEKEIRLRNNGKSKGFPKGAIAGIVIGVVVIVAVIIVLVILFIKKKKNNDKSNEETLADV